MSTIAAAPTLGEVLDGGIGLVGVAGGIDDETSQPSSLAAPSWRP